MVRVQTKIHPREGNPQGLWDTDGLPHPGQKTKPCCGFCRSSGPLSKNKRKGKERQLLRPSQRTKNAVEHEGDGDTNCSWCTWNNPQMLCKKLGRIVKQRKNRCHNCGDRLEYWQEPWRPKEPCCYRLQWKTNCKRWCEKLSGSEIIISQWYIHNSLKFEIQTNHQFSVRRPDIVLLNKKLSSI